MHDSSQVELEELKKLLAENAESIARKLYPDGKREGINWVVADIGGGKGKSFKICISGANAGLCKDFAGGKGHGLIDCVKAVKGCEFKDALNVCREMLGMPVQVAAKTEPRRPAFDWNKCKDNLDDNRLREFAEWRGFSIEHCRKLRSDNLLGVFDGNLALPVLDPHGTCIGAHYFPKGSRGFYTKGATAFPLIIGAITGADRIYAFESPWDAFAYYEKCGLGLKEAIITTRGASNGAKLAGRVSDDSDLVVFRQNDEPDDKGRVADTDWFNEILKTLDRPIKSVRVPARIKDLNDWSKEGAGSKEINAAIESAEVFGEVAGTPLIDLANTPIDHTKTLLGDRFLCVGGGMLFIGPSGIGKSSASAQQDILWSLGREAFGIKPARPLRILTVQAENDDGDLGEMARGVVTGLELTWEETQQVKERVIYVTENSRVGDKLIAWLPSLLRRWKPDILRIDPLFAYLGGDIKDTTVTCQFLREGLNPLLQKFNCAVIVNHHTPKPKSSETTGLWRASDWMYAGAGNADIVGWTRAAMVIDPTHDLAVYRFIAAKRSSRVGWKDEEGVKEWSRHFCHASDGLYWRNANQEDLNRAEDAANEAKGKGGDKPREKGSEAVYELVPVIGRINKQTLIVRANEERNVPLNRARAVITALIGEGRIHEVKVKRSGLRDDVQIARGPGRNDEEGDGE